MKEKVLVLTVFALAVGIYIGLDPIIHQALAGTGGSELSTWYTDLSNALKGYWGKLIAAAFIGMAIIAGKSGGVIPAIFLFFLGVSIGTIPDIINARYTIIF